MKLLTKKQLEKIQNVIKIQGNNGNWNSDQYMCGYYNGMELIRSIIYKDKAKFKEIKDNK
jgi:hypothetical protein